MRRLLALLCLATIAWAKLPRQLANVPIETPDHRNIDLRKYRGKIVMVVLFLTDCDDCVEMINYASKLETQYASRGFQVVGAALNDAAPYEVAPFVQRYRPTFPIGFLRKDALIKFADLSPAGHPIAPIVMLVDALGVVRFEFQGNDSRLKDKKFFPAVVSGLITQRDKHQEPERVTEPVKQ